MKNYYCHLLTNQFEQDAMKEIDKFLAEEFAKPEQSRDYDMIDELTDVYFSLSEMDEQINKVAEQGIINLKEKMCSIYKPNFTKRIKNLATVACVALVILTANLITVSAFDMNIFSFIVDIVDGGFSVNFPGFSSSAISSADVMELSTTPDDPYGMIAECVKYGIDAETPYYLPVNYVLTICSYSEICSNEKDVKFTFQNRENSNQFISFVYELYEDKERISDTKFPNDEHCLSEIEINGRPAILAEEQKDKQFMVVYPVDNLMISIFTQNVSWEEVKQIIDSIK